MNSSQSYEIKCQYFEINTQNGGMVEKLTFHLITFYSTCKKRKRNPGFDFYIL